MVKSLLSISAAALIATAGMASAQTLEKSQGRVGMFDQGGAMYRGVDHSTTSDIYGGNTKRSSTPSLRKIMRMGKGNRQIENNVTSKARIPSDTRNERGLGMFDRAR